MKKPSIPQVPRLEQPRAGFDQSVKESLEVLMGRRGGSIKPLPATASTANIIDKLNELIDRLQG